jgi:hypothetical protein
MADKKEEERETQQLLEKNKEKYEEEQNEMADDTESKPKAKAKKKAAPVVAEQLDPALVDPEAAAAERVEGTTSDAATRAEGQPASETEPDASEGDKASDDEDYAFPTGGDVEVATVEEGGGEGEEQRPLEVEDWVILGEHELVPPRLVGRRAAVLDAPREPWAEADKGDVWVTVRTRDEANALLTIPLTATSEILRGGLSTVHRG